MKVVVEFEGDTHIAELTVIPDDSGELHKCEDCGYIAVNKFSIIVICCGLRWDKYLCNTCTDKTMKEIQLSDYEKGEKD